MLTFEHCRKNLTFKHIAPNHKEIRVSPLTVMFETAVSGPAPQGDGIPNCNRASNLQFAKSDGSIE